MRRRRDGHAGCPHSTYKPFYQQLRAPLPPRAPARWTGGARGGPSAAPAPPLGPAHTSEAPATRPGSSSGNGGGGARRLLEQSFARRGPPGEGDDGPCGLSAWPAAETAVGPRRQRSHQQQHHNSHQQQHTDHQQHSTQQHQQRPKRRKQQHQSLAQQQGSDSDSIIQQRQKKRQQRPRAHRMAPCSRKMVMHCAHALDQQARAGLRTMLPADTDGQAIAALKAVTYARTLVLSRGGSGLAFQPSAAWGAPQAAAGESAEAAAVPSSSSYKARAGGRAGVSMSNGKSSSSSVPQRSVAFHIAPVDEASMVRFDAAPLIASRAGDVRKLAASVAARVAAQGHATLRALGPDATRVALSALVDARRQLQRRGCDFAVLPSRHVGPSGHGGAPEGGGGGSWQEDEEDEAQMLTSVSLHIVRCAPAAPGGSSVAWQLQPWPLGAPAPAARRAPAAALPAAAGGSQAEAAPVPTAVGTDATLVGGKARNAVSSPGAAPQLVAPPAAAPKARAALPSRRPAASGPPPAGGPADWPSPLPAPA